MTLTQKVQEHPTGKGRIFNWGEAWLGFYKTDEGYAARAGWIVPEGFDDDYQSFNCGCPLQGRNHICDTLAEGTDAEEIVRQGAEILKEQTGGRFDLQI